MNNATSLTTKERALIEAALRNYSETNPRKAEKIAGACDHASADAFTQSIIDKLWGRSS